MCESPPGPLNYNLNLHLIIACFFFHYSCTSEENSSGKGEVSLLPAPTFNTWLSYAPDYDIFLSLTDAESLGELHIFPIISNIFGLWCIYFVVPTYSCKWWRHNNLCMLSQWEPFYFHIHKRSSMGTANTFFLSPRPTQTNKCTRATPTHTDSFNKRKTDRKIGNLGQFDWRRQVKRDMLLQGISYYLSSGGSCFECHEKLQHPQPVVPLPNSYSAWNWDNELQLFWGR